MSHAYCESTRPLRDPQPGPKRQLGPESSTVLDAVGRTPVVTLGRLNTRPDVEILVKLDYLNPAGSAKDRALVRMIEEAEASGELEPGATIIESTSGNFGVAMAMAGAVRGYRVICIVDPKITNVIEQMILSLGAEIVYATDADETGSYLRHRLALRSELLDSIPGAWCPDQYSNRAAIRAHFDGTGREIVEDVDGELDVLVIAAGTGATITGAGRRVKNEIPGARVVAADAFGSKIFDDEVHRWLQKGLGSGLSADELDNLDLSVIDEARLIGDQDAFNTARALARYEGLLAGGSSGCAVFAALTIARNAPSGTRILTLLPDGMARYLFEHQSDQWMRDHGLETGSNIDDLFKAVDTWCEQATTSTGTGGLTVHKKGS
jgi:cysteine synthase